MAFHFWLGNPSTSDVTVTLTGQSLSVDQGAAANTLSVAASGQDIAASQGTATATYSMAAVGQAITSAIESVSKTVTVALTGLALSVAGGTVLAGGQNFDAALTGQSLSVARGTVTATLPSVSILSGIASTSTSNTSSYSSGAFTPAANDYLFAFIIATDTTLDGTITDTQSLGWTRISSVTSHTTNKYIVFKSNTVAAAVSTTVTWDCTGDNATGASIAIVRVADSDGGVRQFVTATGVAANAPNVTFANNCLTTSGIIFGTANKSNPHGNTSPAGYTAINGNAYNTPTTGNATSSKNSGETGTTITAGGLSATDWTTFAVEIFGLGTTKRFLTSNSNAIGQGTLTPLTTEGDKSAALTGQSLTASQGSITANPSLALSGQAVTAAQGSATASPSLALSGQALVSGQGTLTSVSGGSAAVSGQSSTLIIGTLTAVITYPVRYIRDALNGSSGNAASYWVDIQAFDASGTNIASGKTVTANFTPSEGALTQITNGDTNTNNYVASANAHSRVTVDLGATYNIASVTRFHYNGDNRTFYGTKTETSVDGITWTVIFSSAVSGEYAEQSGGKNNVTLPAPAVNNQQLGTVIPAYTVDSGHWSDYTRTAAIPGSYAVINPNSGPGTSVNSTIEGYVTNFHAAGGKILGYISSAYTGRTVAAVKADVDTYRTLYAIDGFFIDEMTTTNVGGNVAYYLEVYDYIKSLGAYHVVTNPSGAVAEIYVSNPVADTFVIFEGTSSAHVNFAMPTWTDNYPATRFAWIVHTTATSGAANDIVTRARNERTQYVFVTDDILANPYDTSPSYWTTFAANIAAGSGYLVGKSNTLSLGTLPASNSVALTGQAVTVARDSVTPSQANSVQLTGQSVTASQGSAAALSSKALSGQSTSIAQGSALVSNSKILTGQSASIAQGSVGISADGSAALTGQSLVASNGSISWVVDLALSGQSLSVEQGSTAGSGSVSATGQAVTATQASVSASQANSVQLTGQALSVGQGSSAAASSKAISGQSVSIAQGTTTGSKANNLTGQSLSAQQGALGISAGGSAALSGQGLSVSQGSLTGAMDRALTGQAVTLTGGSVAVTRSITLTGQVVSVVQSSVSANGNFFTALTGQSLSSSVGNLLAANSKTLAGQEAAASTGSVGSGSVMALFGLGNSASINSLAASVDSGLTGQSLSVTHSSLNKNFLSALSGQGLTIEKGLITSSGDSQVISSVEISVSYKLQSIEVDLAQPSIAVSYKTQTVKVNI